MAKVTELTRLVVEDFDKEDQPLVSKIARSYNLLIEQIGNAFNKGIDSDNLAQQYPIITVTVDAAGIPTPSLQIKYELKSKLRGMQVINALNLTDSTPITGAPFIVYEISSNVITVKQITGLPAGKQFSLSVILIG